MRGAFYALEQDKLVDYARLVFRLAGRFKDISQDDVLTPIVEQVGLDPKPLRSRSDL